MENKWETKLTRIDINGRSISIAAQIANLALRDTIRLVVFGDSLRVSRGREGEEQLHLTMQIKGAQIAGHPAIAVRNMLRRFYSGFSKFHVVGRFNVSPHEADEVIKQLLDGGYVEFDERQDGADYYKPTGKGVKLIQASAVNKMPRAKAEQIVAQLMKRVGEINANAEYVYRVSTVIVFGSYARGEPLLSDVDIATELKRKWPNYEHQP